ncbi:MAG: beta-lactamase family protein [Bdellovibrionales bacterium]|nr:beta-lactamase family protein [Bdellovibrionales bacterium]
MSVSRTVKSLNWSRVSEALSAAAHQYVAGAPVPPKKDLVFPGAVLTVSQGGELLFRSSVGCRSLLPEPSPMREDIVFDVASLTKPLVTTSLLMQLVDRGNLEVDRRMSRILQTFGTHGKERMTVRHLLAHCSGYPATSPYYRQIANADRGRRAGMMTSRGAVETIYNEILRAKIENLPGKVTKYSDIGFILLGHALEVLYGMPLEKLVVKYLLRPLKLQQSGYIELSNLRRRGLETVNEIIAPTAQCPWRGRVLCGEVHDDNAWAMGGVSAHAGLFTTATDVNALVNELLECYHGRGTFVSREVVREFWKRDETVPNSTWALGWDTPSPKNSASGRYFSPQSVGHLSFTGCSIWVEPERELSVVLLSNRIHPSVDNNNIRDFRPLIHDLVLETLGYV